MENSTKKRVRSANWDDQEKQLLTQLVTEKIHIIENKDTSTNTNNMKKAAWHEVLSCFNSVNKTKRDLTQIMTQWRNTKGKVKSRESEYRRARLITGGGPPPPSPSAEDLAIIEALPNEFVVDSNCFDSDSLYMKTVKQLQAESPNIQTECKTPTLPASDQIGESQEVIKISEDSEKPDSNILITTTPVSASIINNQRIKCRPVKLLKNKAKDDYEYQLFLLAKKSKERDNERAEEAHKQKMLILNLEAEYWKKKLNDLN